MSYEREHRSRLPPRRFVRLAWYAHRGLYHVTGGRVGLWRAKSNRWGTLRLTTTGRRTGRERSVILGYYEDGPNLVTLAMNGWAEASRRGGSTSKSIPKQESTSPTVRARSRHAPPKEKNALACGPGGGRSTRGWTPTRRCGRRRLRSLSRASAHACPMTRPEHLGLRAAAEGGQCPASPRSRARQLQRALHRPSARSHCTRGGSAGGGCARPLLPH